MSYALREEIERRRLRREGLEQEAARERAEEFRLVEADRRRQQQADQDAQTERDARARATAELDAVLAAVRALLPGADQLAPRVLGALADYRAVAESIHQRRTVPATRFPEQVLNQHPVARMLPWLTMLADDPANSPTEPTRDTNAGAPDAESTHPPHGAQRGSRARQRAADAHAPQPRDS